MRRRGPAVPGWTTLLLFAFLGTVAPAPLRAAPAAAGTGAVEAVRRTSTRRFRAAGEPRAPAPSARRSAPPRRRGPALPRTAGLAATGPAPPSLGLAAGSGPGTLATDGALAIESIRTLTPEETGFSTSTTCEPSVACNGAVVFVTGNWFAAVSGDGGTTYQSIDPDTFFPSAAGGFCCDQSVIYAPSVDLFLWVLLYSGDPLGGNIERLAVATSAEVLQGSWTYIDVSSVEVAGLGDGLDFPDLAVGANSLYLTTEVFDSSGNFKESALLRFSLADLAGSGPVAWDQWTSADFGPRSAQDCGTRYYAAATLSTGSLRVYWVDEGSPTLNATIVPVGTFDDSDYASRDPSGKDWMSDSDSRMLGGALAGGELWFGWNAGAGGRYGIPNPYIELARIRTSDFALLEQRPLWSPAFAAAFPALSADAGGEVGITFAAGGGAIYPSHAVGLLGGTPRFAFAAAGTGSPRDRRWGDFLAIRRRQPGGAGFSATGFTLRGGRGDRNARPDIVFFGRGVPSAPAYTVSGTVLDGLGGAAPAVEVTAGLRSAATDGAGAYGVAGLDPGAVLVTPSLPGYGFLPPSRRLTLAADAPGADFTAIPRTMTLHAKAGMLRRAAAAGRDAARARGRFTFTPASPDATFDPMADDLSFVVDGAGAGLSLAVPAGDPGWTVSGAQMTWRSPAGASPRVKVVLRVDRGTFSASASRADLGGTPAEPVTVQVRFGNDFGDETSAWHARGPSRLVR